MLEIYSRVGSESPPFYANPLASHILVTSLVVVNIDRPAVVDWVRPPRSRLSAQGNSLLDIFRALLPPLPCVACCCKRHCCLLLRHVHGEQNHPTAVHGVVTLKNLGRVSRCVGADRLVCLQHGKRVGFNRVLALLVPRVDSSSAIWNLCSRQVLCCWKWFQQ